MKFYLHKGLIIGVITVASLFTIWMWDIEKGKNDNRIIHSAWKDDHDLSRWLLYWVSALAGLIGLLFSILFLTGINKKLSKWWKDIQASQNA